MATTLEAPARAAALGYDGGLTCAINVTDLDASIAWYRDVLGMNFLYRVDEIAWAELESPVGRVNIGLAQRESVIQGGGATPTFGVIDLDAAKAVLDAAGVRQDGPVQEIPAMVRLLTFYDPDGNALMLYQDLAGQG
ncbi:VOC family protein [Sphingomonas sp. KR3-1]|uniref:VOC family protein n=1 Tax=Sphingomonas sp. KR3-1 TaxID=3156611 RepID=UPI0032B37554